MTKRTGLAAAMEELTIDKAVEQLDHGQWVVVQWFTKINDYVEPPLVVGVFSNPTDALAERDRMHAEVLEMPADVTAVHGIPITHVAPLFAPEAT